MKRLFFLFLLQSVLFTALAQSYPPTSSPRLDFALQLRVTIGAPYTIGSTQHGRRTVVPITGGTFEGPGLKGDILSGGADYQLGNADGSRTELEAIYDIRTADGVVIHVRNRGLVCIGRDHNGQPSSYFKAAPQFEAPTASPYSWLNDALFVCQPEEVEGFNGIVLNVWKVN